MGRLTLRLPLASNAVVVTSVHWLLGRARSDDASTRTDALGLPPVAFNTTLPPDTATVVRFGAVAVSGAASMVKESIRRLPVPPRLSLYTPNPVIEPSSGGGTAGVGETKYNNSNGPKELP